MDTWDNDSDKLTLAWLQDGEVHGALTLRRPMSVDGGTWMKLLDHDVERINAIGDGWNQKTGHHRWEGLYDADKEGNPLRPSVVTPTPFESKDAWNSNLTDPADVLKFLMARNKYAGAIGMASNYAANLDMAGAFDPDRHLFCLSFPAFLITLATATVAVAVWLTGETKGSPKIGQVLSQIATISPGLFVATTATAILMTPTLYYLASGASMLGSFLKTLEERSRDPEKNNKIKQQSQTIQKLEEENRKLREQLGITDQEK